MKRLLLIVLIITLPLIAFFQYKNYRRFHPPVDYEFAISDAIDADYHDQSMVDEYFVKAVEIGSFARTQWRNSDIDVRFPSEDVVAEVNAAKYYNQLVSRVNYLQSRLIASQELKSEGFNNEDIKLMEAGYTKDQLKWINTKINLILIAFGDQSNAVWNVQKQLISKGYEHRLDGLFGIDTQNAIISFQQDNQIYPSGTLNEETFELLFLN